MDKIPTNFSELEEAFEEEMEKNDNPNSRIYNLLFAGIKMNHKSTQKVYHKVDEIKNSIRYWIGLLVSVISIVGFIFKLFL